ncbi:MAG: ABC-F family ATP-binding cassette domain-containing protein, partial [Lachnospiraceae bacterium]|nr:ABC-F family ATP-binding cassette domain-containing protein [Lachnospiraceae bacterium]
MSGANLLIFDEPTNHLDIAAKEVFEDAIMHFPGTIIIVSHDRYLLQHVPTAILELTENGIIKYPGQYDYYEEKREELSGGISAAQNSAEYDPKARRTDPGKLSAGSESLAAGSGGQDAGSARRPENSPSGSSSAAALSRSVQTAQSKDAQTALTKETQIVLTGADAYRA